MPLGGYSKQPLHFQSIRLDSCGIEVIHTCAFHGLHGVGTLDLKDNKLTKAPQLHAMKTGLITLGLGGNKLVSIPLDYFEGFTSLLYLWLQRNMLSTFPNLAYQAIQKSIYRLYLQENKIKRIDRLQSGTHFKDLTTLRLNNNTLEAFDIQFLSHFGAKGVVHLEGNQLTTLNDPAEVVGKSSGFLILGNNPWRCSRDISWMSKRGRHSSWNVVSPDVESSPVCAEPACLRGKVASKLGKWLLYDAMVA